MQPIVWTIAGSDSSGGAGIQCDLLTLQHLGVSGCSVVTAITAQNHHAVIALHPLNPDQIVAQISALESRLMPAAVKIGMLGSLETIAVIQNFLQSYEGKVVLDPVFFASSGKMLVHPVDQQYYRNRLIALFSHVEMLTPNLLEAALLTGIKVRSDHEIEKAARILLNFGPKSVLIKGGHGFDPHYCHDYFTDGVSSFWLRGDRVQKQKVRGTGCALSSAIAAGLAHDYELKDAVVIGKMYVNKGIRLAKPQEKHPALMFHAGWPTDEIDLPCLTNAPQYGPVIAFQDCGPNKIGLYPIVDSCEWLKKLLPAGIKTIQLRIKGLPLKQLQSEIQHAIEIAKYFDAKLFINDYWEWALLYGAYGVHLGQEDIQQADISKIKEAGLRLGISTHCYYEVARAHAMRPSYIAVGPIYPTSTKLMSFQPQGLFHLQRWLQLLSSYQVVAIGGINEERLAEILKMGAEGVAMISEITQAPDPLQKIKDLLQIMKRD